MNAHGDNNFKFLSVDWSGEVVSSTQIKRTYDNPIQYARFSKGGKDFLKVVEEGEEESSGAGSGLLGAVVGGVLFDASAAGSIIGVASGRTSGKPPIVTFYEIKRDGSVEILVENP